MTFDDWWQTLPTREQARMVKDDCAEAWNVGAEEERKACQVFCRVLAKRMKTAAEKDAANSCAEVIYMRSNAS